MKENNVHDEMQQSVEEIEKSCEEEFPLPPMVYDAIEKYMKKNRFLMLFAPPLEALEQIENLILEQENEMWCLDFELIANLMDKIITVEMIPEHVEDNIEYYIGKIINDPMYKLHVPLIKEAYEAYKSGFYKLCVFPLISIFDHVFSLWCEGKVKLNSISIDEKPNIFKLYTKVKPEKYENAEEEYFARIFTHSVIRMYKKLFLSIPNELSKELNRNSIMHGFYDYESINKIDVLKLFQLLKSAMVLRIADSSQLIQLQNNK
ncbi:hypothetical protein ACQKF0_09405 [Bacillus wiedmannii]|uniref:hypothetical protein n=1 Tax=Bacillus wiedmannii TaxID=1890302 RepID=UPI003CE8F6AD